MRLTEELAQQDFKSQYQSSLSSLGSALSSPWTLDGFCKNLGRLLRICLLGKRNRIGQWTPIWTSVMSVFMTSSTMRLAFRKMERAFILRMASLVSAHAFTLSASCSKVEKMLMPASRRRVAKSPAHCSFAHSVQSSRLTLESPSFLIRGKNLLMSMIGLWKMWDFSTRFGMSWMIRTAASHAVPWATTWNFPTPSSLNTCATMSPSILLQPCCCRSPGREPQL
mmetsp:Transcript_90564/g.236014  ORF Transcript_90564/g.236014 Transcript_90564/m.236014 type:complete len:224 (-) Transcript_90564:19-690(-)